MTEAIRILIVDDHAVVREGLAAIISTKPDLRVIGEASNGEQAVQQARALAPDVILMDLQMPVKSGLEAIREIRQENPHARILVLTSFADDDQVVAAIQAGVLGYMLKESASRELLEAIRSVYRGESPMHPAVARKLVLGLNKPAPVEGNPLTERETEVLKLLARGWSNQAIADELNISQATVHFHTGNILSKLQLENRTQAVLYALRNKLVRLDE
jgi:two-component system, NarL family, response regulator LiaR